MQLAFPNNIFLGENYQFYNMISDIMHSIIILFFLIVPTNYGYLLFLKSLFGFLYNTFQRCKHFISLFIDENRSDYENKFNFYPILYYNHILLQEFKNILRYKFDSYASTIDWSIMYTDDLQNETALILELKTSVLNHKYKMNWCGKTIFDASHVNINTFNGKNLPLNGLLPNNIINIKQCRYMINEIKTNSSHIIDVRKFNTICNEKAVFIYKKILGNLFK